MAAVASRWAEASVLTAPERGGRLAHSRPPAEPADGARAGRDVLPARRGKTPGRETSAEAGEGVTGWTVGVLGSSRSTTGASTTRREIRAPGGAAGRRTRPGTRRARRRPRGRRGAAARPGNPGVPGAGLRSAAGADGPATSQGRRGPGEVGAAGAGAPERHAAGQPAEEAFGRRGHGGGGAPAPAGPPGTGPAPDGPAGRAGPSAGERCGRRRSGRRRPGRRRRAAGAGAAARLRRRPGRGHR